MKLGLGICLAAACGSAPDHHLPDAPSSGSGVAEPCAITITSTEISGTTGSGSGSCTAMLDNSGTFNSQWVAPGSDADAVMGGIACTITPGVVPQTLHLDSGTTGCTVEIDDDSDLNGTVDSWDGSGGSTIDVVLTDLDPVSGTVQLTLFDFSENMLTVSGTF